MAASLHLARYSPRGVGRMLRTMRRHRPALEATPGLAAARLCFMAELDRATGGSPRPLQWALLCGWESGEARDEFFAESPLLRRFQAGARESWSVSLETVRVVMGDWHGWQPQTDGVAPLAPDEPLIAMTYGMVSARHLPAFTWHNRKIVREMSSDPALGMMVGVADHPRARATFSVWRSKGEMVRFAYGPRPHNPIQRRSLDVPWGYDWFFARFRPVAATGTWGGRDPLAEFGGLEP